MTEKSIDELQQTQPSVVDDQPQEKPRFSQKDREFWIKWSADLKALAEEATKLADKVRAKPEFQKIKHKIKYPKFPSDIERLE